MREPSRKNDIEALIKTVQSQYVKIESLYTSSLQKKEIDSHLKIEVKNYLENARSILDYCAHDIAEVLGISATKIYFPIVERTANSNSFRGAIGRNLPGLELENKKVFDYLESIQPYHEHFSWLADFAAVNIDIKHSQLTPQTRNEIQRIKSTHIGGGSVSWNPGAVRFGSGVYINGVPVNPHTQMPVSTPETTVTKEIWVDFRFNDKISALLLLKKIYDEIPKIINDIYQIL